MDDDDDLMSDEQLALLRAVVGALNAGAENIYAAVSLALPSPPPRGDIDAVVRILRLDRVDFQIGDPVNTVVGRVLDLLEAAAGGYDLDDQPEIDDRY